MTDPVPRTTACSRCLEEIPLGALVCPGCGSILGAVVTIHGSREKDPTFVPFPEPVANRGTAKRREQDIQMMKEKKHWPSKTLAMKKWDPQTNRIEFAVWDGTTLQIDALQAFDEIARPPTLTSNATPEEIVDAGWTVD